MDALAVVADQQKHFGGGARTHTVCLDQVGGELLGQQLEMQVMIFDFCVEVQPAPGNRSQAGFGRGRR